MIFYFPLKINNETKITFTENKILPLFLLSGPGARAVGPTIGGAHNAAECASSAVGCYGAQHSCCDPVVSELSIANSGTNVLVRILQYRHVLIRGMAGGSRINPQIHAAARRDVVED